MNWYKKRKIFKKTDEKSRGAPGQEQPKKYELLLQCNITKIEIYIKVELIQQFYFVNLSITKYLNVIIFIIALFQLSKKEKQSKGQ